MKTRIIYLCLLVIFSTTGCIPTQTIKGDGNITTENIPVSEYDCLELEGGGMVVNYTQSDAPEGLEIKTDRNIFEKYGHSCISPWQYNHVIQRLWTL